jgi:hypothetical protein
MTSGVSFDVVDDVDCWGGTENGNLRPQFADIRKVALSSSLNMAGGATSETTSVLGLNAQAASTSDHLTRQRRYSAASTERPS